MLGEILLAPTELRSILTSQWAWDLASVLSTIPDSLFTSNTASWWPGGRSYARSKRYLKNTPEKEMLWDIKIMLGWEEWLSRTLSLGINNIEPYDYFLLQALLSVSSWIKWYGNCFKMPLDSLFFLPVLESPCVTKGALPPVAHWLLTFYTM